MIVRPVVRVPFAADARHPPVVSVACSTCPVARLTERHLAYITSSRAYVAHSCAWVSALTMTRRNLSLAREQGTTTNTAGAGGP